MKDISEKKHITCVGKKHELTRQSPNRRAHRQIYMCTCISLVPHAFWKVLEDNSRATHSANDAVHMQHTKHSKTKHRLPQPTNLQ